MNCPVACSKGYDCDVPATGPRFTDCGRAYHRLDVTVQAQIMSLIVRLCKERKMSVLLISHNISLMAQYADRISVMYAGQIVESNDISPFIENPPSLFEGINESNSYTG